MEYLLGTDIGTSGTKTILVDIKGNLISQDLQEYDVITLKPLWAEQWPETWLEATKTSIQNTVAKSGVAPQDIKGLAISGLYGGSGIPLDESGWTAALKRKSNGLWTISERRSCCPSPTTVLTPIMDIQKYCGLKTMSQKIGRK